MVAPIRLDPPRTRGGHLLQQLTGRPGSTCDALAAAWSIGQVEG